MPSIAKELAAFGFKLTQTGGNCTAYVRDDGEVSEYIVHADGWRIPERLRDAVSVSTCTRDNDPDTLEGYTLANVIGALSDERDDYVLLSLRLCNYIER